MKIKTAVSIILGLSVAALCAAGPPADFWIEGGRTVVDQSHRRITVHQPFNRIISLYGAHSENLFALGCREQLIGVSPHEDYPPEAAQKPVFSYHDDPEKFLAARPDLVLTRPMIDRGYPQFVQRLEKSGITVVSLQPGTVEEMIGYWRILGILTGREDPAKHMADRFNRTVARLRLLTADIHPKKRVYFEAIHTKMKTFSPDSMAVFALETAGGINVAADAQPVRDTNIAAHPGEGRRHRCLPRPVRNHEPADRRTHQGRKRVQGHPGGPDRPGPHHRRTPGLTAHPASAGRDF
ncbi:MAG: ABC transporter substrate-binding protein [Desulfobacterales bacterium]|nr:ABC transporter substrate-binding protein [Desulfobacterales bacterium]